MPSKIAVAVDDDATTTLERKPDMGKLVVRRTACGAFASATPKDEVVLRLAYAYADALLSSADAFLHKCGRFVQPAAQRRVNLARAACLARDVTRIAAPLGALLCHSARIK